MAESQDKRPDLISDGKRMRLVWRPEHGNGDSTQHIIDRTKATVRGHPTWKIFMGEVPQPIIRGSEQEPPHYVYLDDQACYTIWKSGLYTDTELKTYWPYDFDHQGNIKAGRKNRGRAAWVDGPTVELAKGKLRGKEKWYEFSGAPDVTEYKPLRPATKTKMELQVEAEFAAQKAREAAGVMDPEASGTPTRMTSATGVRTPGGTPVTNTDEIHPAQTSPRTTRLEKVCSLRPSPPKNLPKHWQMPVSSTPVSSLQNGGNTQPFPTRSPRGSSSDDAPYNARKALAEASSPNDTPPKTPPSKRKATGPFLLSSSSASASESPEHKRFKLGERRQSSLPAQLPHKPESSSPIDERVNQGERPSSLPLASSESVPDVDSDASSEEDEFLATIDVGKAFGQKH